MESESIGDRLGRVRSLLVSSEPFFGYVFETKQVILPEVC